jgi:hypothetical protein
MTRTREQWVDFLAERFVGTKYAVPPAEYHDWVVARVDADDDSEDVAAAWQEQRDRALADDGS